MDWDNDGDLDLVTGEADGRIRIYRNGATTGTPVLGAPVYLRVGSSTFQPSGQFSKPDVVDWNQDGRLDIVCGDGNGNIHLLLNTGTAASPAFANSTLIRGGGEPLSVGSRASPVVVDWNQDGKKDLVVGNSEGKLYYFQNTGTNASPAFSGAGESLTAGNGFIDVGYYARPEIVDWDNDGVMDLIVGFEDYQSPAQAMYYFHAAAPLTVSIADTSVVEGTGGSASATFTVTLSAVAAQTISVRYGTSNGTAQAGSDYTAVSGTLTFSTGQRTRTITVPIVTDSFQEGAENFLVNLSQPNNVSITDGQALCTIEDDDAPPTVSINDVTVLEGDSGWADALFTVRLSSARAQQVTVQYLTAGGTATSSVDFTATSGILVFEPGQTVLTIAVPVMGDTFLEGTETFVVNLAAPTNATLADAQGTGTIFDDDALRLTIGDVTVSESEAAAAVTVNLSAVSAQPVTFNYATVAVTAAAGGDFTARSGTITLDPGTTQAVLSIPLLNDELDEDEETFRVVITDPSGAMINRGQADVAVLDDDPEPALSIDDALQTEGHSGTSSATFTVRLSAASGRTVRVAYATVGGTATPGTDYTATVGTLEIASGQSSGTFTVPVRGDTAQEGNETFAVGLSDAVNATIADGDATGTIRDDDTGSPEVKVLLKAQEVRDGQSTVINFGSVRKGAKGPTRTFTVRNIGQSPLSLGAVRLPRGFQLVNGLVAQLAPGQSDTFAVRLLTTTVARRSGQVRFATGDADENPFNFPIKGVVTAVRTTRARAMAAPAEEAQVISQRRPEYAGVFCLVRSPWIELAS